MEKFMEGVPPPKAKPLPTCEAVRKRHEDNAYEQVALPGKNCFEGTGGH